jgi:hypothetical protein
VGVKVTLILQVPVEGIDAGQVVAPKGPVAVTLVTFNAVGSSLTKVITWAALVVPTV